MSDNDEDNSNKMDSLSDSEDKADGNNTDDNCSSNIQTPNSSPVRQGRKLAPKTPKSKLKSLSTPLSLLHSNKQKVLHDKIHDMASQDRSQRLKLTKVKERERTERI